MKTGNEVNFDTLVGEKATLFLTPSTANRFQLGSVIFEVIEDENDGYRSAMEAVKIVNDNAPKKVLLAEVTIGKTSVINECIYTLIDSSGHEWLRFGTDNADDYYPSFHFNWSPKETEDIELIKKLIK